MRKIQTEVLVIGGGATGSGVIRDLAMRGFKAVLVEKGDLTHGTTGRYHGLLHSGGRYVVKDPQAAKECIEENRILRRIMPHCIEDTGGFFVLTPWDDPDYAPRFLEGCHRAGIPVEEVPIRQMLREEPRLNPQITHCFRVPDASADSFLGADANAESARQHGAQVLPYHQVLRLLCQAERVIGALCHDLVQDEEVEIQADLVVNASGAWAGQIAASAGVPLKIIPGKGTMIAANHRIVNTVINRCKLPGDGDILVPAHTVAVIGTTDIKVKDPDRFAIEPWEIQLMLAEGEKIVPGFQDLRMLRAWAGVRPLYQETRAGEVDDTRQVTRAFVLLDHQPRDGVSGLVTITSGKWTTYRKMAEVTVDLVCAKLGVQRECRTHMELLPGTHQEKYHIQGGRLAEIEKEAAYGDLVCECELATYAQVTQAITTGQAQTIDDVRRDVRLGMGPCQGGFCTYRVAGMLHGLRRQTVEATNVALRDFLQERWKGLLPILWGQQLRQERLDELIYLSVLNADHLPGPQASRLAPELYLPSTTPSSNSAGRSESSALPSSSAPPLPRPTASFPATALKDPASVDVLVVGAGLAGLSAAWRAVRAGRRVRVIAKGWGTTHWTTGCIDVLGYLPGQDKPVVALQEDLASFVQQNPRHPYAFLALDRLETALGEFQELCASAGYPLHGSLERNWLLPTALGTLRPTCLAPETMIAGDSRSQAPMLVVGFERFVDFYPAWIAANLIAQGIPAEGLLLDMASLREDRFVTSRTLAMKFDKPGFRAEVAAALKGRLGGAARVGFPAVLGLRNPIEVLRDLEGYLGLPVFEIPTPPGSISGMRLHQLLLDSIQKGGGRVYEGMQALSAEVGNGRVQAVWTEAAARQRAHRAESFILATGGILGGGLRADHQGTVMETVFGLPVQSPGDRDRWFQREFLSPTGHPIYSAGLEVDSAFRPVDAQGAAVYENLYAVGSALSGFDPIRERSLEGAALATGLAVGSWLAENR